MASKSLYKIVDSGERGMVAVATRDIMAGELVMEEKEPLLFFTQADCEHYKCDEPNMEFAFAGYNAFVTNVSPDNQRRILSLYGPTSGATPDYLRKFLQKKTQLRCGSDGNFIALTPEEVETMIKVIQVVRLNMFATENDVYNVYSEITRFSHSCASNCYYKFVEQAIVCCARCFVKAGEELTISYNALRDMDPIHERRHKYLEVKEFMCHCPRCDAHGDDTRQFDCFDSACKGVMMVRHPINKKDVRNCANTGVQYEEPHLLPCSVCHRTASDAYQIEMLALEVFLQQLGPQITQRFGEIVDEHRQDEMEPLYKVLQTIRIPSRHAASLPLLRVKWRVLHKLYQDTCPRFQSELQEAVKGYLFALENICTYPGEILSAELIMIAAHCSHFCPEPVFPPEQEKELCLKTLRMQLLLLGRGTRDSVLDDISAKCHERLPSTRSSEICAFCEESPQNAALTLSRCGKCRQVCYCSAGCQKAHWKIHKKTCKQTVGKA